MPGERNIAAVAALLADPTRTAILTMLLDGRSWPAGDLARAVHVSPSTASNHLSKLLEHGLLKVEQQGRHRYFRLADPAVAQLLESLAVFAPSMPIRSLRESEAFKAVRAARMCYNHFAGRLGVTLSDALVEKELLTKVDGGYLVTSAGERWLQEIGIESIPLKQHGRIFAIHHIDWSERFYHIGDNMGSALARRFFELDWVKRGRINRAVYLTEAGKQALLKDLGLNLDGERAANVS